MSRIRGLPAAGAAPWRAWLGVLSLGSVAAGSRLRLGQFHLLVYRGLQKAKGPRAILGHHTTHETVVAAIDKSGDVAPILLVE